MTSERRRRDIPQFYDAFALERASLAEPPAPLEGLAGTVLSEDPASGSQTLLVELPPGWRTEHRGTEATLELVTLRGDVALEGDRVGSGAYVSVAQGCGGGELSSDHGGLAFAYWNPNLPAFPPPLTANRVTRLRELEWIESVPGYHGTMHKSLRVPDPTGDGYDGGPGGHLRLMYMAPGMAAAFQHVHHECLEEVVLLGGDCMVATAGVMGLGSVVSHPQEWWHGPFASHSGAIFLVHTDAPMGFPWPPREFPLAQEACDGYLDGAAWDVHPRHAEAAAVPALAALHARDEYRAWDAAADAFADDAGRTVASDFRASWTRQP